MKRLSAVVPAALCLGLSFSVLASDPTAHDVAVPATSGAVLTVEWTGSALPGASGAANGCQMGVDDSHDINLTVPDGLYDQYNVSADFHVEWDASPALDPTGTVHDPDLVLSVYQGSTDLDDSDGGEPQENVGIGNPAAGTYTAVVCPFFASGPTPYRAKLTITVTGTKTCLNPPTKALAHSTAADSGSGFKRGDDEFGGWPNFDLFQLQAAAQAPSALSGRGWQGRYQSALFDRGLGVPTFLWARTDASIAAVGPLTEKELLIARARVHLRNEAKKLKLTPAMIDQAEVTDAQYNGNGPAVVRFKQRVNGREVYNRSLNVLLDRAGKPVAVSGYFANGYVPAQVASTTFVRSAQQAVASAWNSMGGTLDAAQLTRSAVSGAYELFSMPELAGTYSFERAPRTKALYYPRNASLEPAYYVELMARTKANRQLSGYAFVVSAVDGAILHRENLVAEAGFSYRVFADPAGDHHPYDEPLGNSYIPFTGSGPLSQPVATGAASNLITLEHGPISTGDPWLADAATQTTGNHVDACIDTYDVQGVPIAVPPPVNSCVPTLEPRAKTTGDHAFDFPIAAYDDPSTSDARNAAVVSMFYLTNWLHDWWYDHGFDEVSGNAQTSNYGRGGSEGDPLLAQGQDGSGRNNANMATPSDGSSPVMQQYLFNGEIKGKVEVTAPAAIGSIAFNGVEYGPQTFDYTGDAVIVNDGFDPPGDGCTGLTTPAVPVTPPSPAPGVPVVPVPVVVPDPNLMGKIAIIDRGGGCPGSYKVRWALLSGASAVVLVHNADGPPPFLVNGDVPIDSPVQPTNNVYQLPIVTIRKDDGQKIKDAIAAGQAVSMHLVREPTIDLDGTLDNLIIAHEYFHYVHHRLTSSSSHQTGAMSEGWADFDALMLSVRPEDQLVPGNSSWQGAYAGAVYVVHDLYFGIRRAPYSTDFSKNPLTFRHLIEGEPLPVDKAPLNGDPNGVNNSEVHNAGEIWANAMWECYSGLLNDPRHTFAEAQSRMQDYVIAGMKLTPADATYTEQRDAVLAAVLASDFQDYADCSQGFARRGMGLNAISAARSSTDFSGVTEDYAGFVCKADVVAGGGSTVSETSNGRFGGALNLLLLLPLLGLAGLRRRR